MWPSKTTYILLLFIPSHNFLFRFDIRGATTAALKRRLMFLTHHLSNAPQPQPLVRLKLFLYQQLQVSVLMCTLTLKLKISTRGRGAYQKYIFCVNRLMVISRKLGLEAVSEGYSLIRGCR